ncbi:hypothetical protein Y032_0020g28 [Ancylostoma ceylanicum]|uniref:Secreted protein n=1 Tax=Ancylostoma ceylanicum TaxID=53326 RepID=A0A016V2C4_9BILA|nr:hypothetical protein Y032_0020g28 [Ancylostoma ceylanicum]
MALIVAIVLLVVRNRKLGKETDDKEKSLRASIQSRESEEPSYPFPEYSGENDASAPAQWNRVTDQEAVERIDAEIRKERKKERENEKQKEQERSRRKRERESRKEKEEQDEGSASQEDS